MWSGNPNAELADPWAKVQLTSHGQPLGPVGILRGSHPRAGAASASEEQPPGDRNLLKNLAIMAGLRLVIERHPG